MRTLFEKVIAEDLRALSGEVLPSEAGEVFEAMISTAAHGDEEESSACLEYLSEALDRAKLRG